MFIRQKLFDGSPQLNRFFSGLNPRQPFKLFLPPLPPFSDLVRSQLDLFRNMAVEPFLKRQ